MELAVELGDDDAGADLVEVVGGREPFDRLVADATAHVDLGVVAVDQRRLGLLEVGEALAQHVDLGVDRVVGDDRALDLDAQRVVALEGDLGTHLDDRVELDVAVVLARGDVDLGRRDHVDRLRDDGLGVVLGQRVTQRLVAGDLGAELGLEEAPGRLAGAEPRHPHLVGDLAERGVDRTLEVGGRDGDVEA